MIPKIFWVIGISILSGFVYFWGGQGKIPHSKTLRRFICPLLFFALFFALRGFQTLKLAHILPYIVTYILSAVALSTYHDYCGFDNFFLAGLGYGLSALPLVWCGIPCNLILARSIILAVTIWAIRIKSGKVFTEEWWSGFLYCASVPILLI